MGIVENLKKIVNKNREEVATVVTLGLSAKAVGDGFLDASELEAFEQRMREARENGGI